MNDYLMNRYTIAAKEYYDIPSCMHESPRGYYDLLILRKFLKSLKTSDIDNHTIEFDMYFKGFIIFNSKIYVCVRKLILRFVELSIFIAKYSLNFRYYYYSNLKNISFPRKLRLVMIYLHTCLFCNNPNKEDTYIHENSYKYGYIYCSFCKPFVTHIIHRKPIKNYLKKLRLFSRAIGKLMIIYNNVIENRYKPGGVFFLEAQERFNEFFKI